jgi:PPP family 3-phenylpropionic acid transporter
VTDYRRLISGFYFVYFASAAILLPNLPLIFDDAGYSGSQIGWLLALPPAMSIVAAPTWGAVADATGRGRALLALALAGSGTAALALGVTAAYAATAAIMLMFALAIAPVVPFTDAASVAEIDDSSRYGKLRLWGALGWGLAAPIAGFSIDRLGLGYAPVFFAAGMLVLLIMTRRMPVAIRGARLTGRLKAALASSRGWIPLLGGALVAGITGGTVIGYLFLLLRSLGASSLTMGLALAIATLSEVVAFSSAGRVIDRLGVGGTMLLGVAAGGIRLLILGFVPSVGWALAAQLLHGFTFSLPLAAGVMGAAKLSPKGLGTTGQGVFSAVFLGLGPTIGVVLAGYLLNQGSEHSMMIAMGVLVLIAGVAVAIPLLRASDL